MVQQIVLPIKDSNVLKMVQDTLLDSFRAGRPQVIGKVVAYRDKHLYGLKRM